jgi:hypothetical protein
MFSIRFLVPGQGVGTLRCGTLPDEPFAQGEIPRLFEKELSRITGIEAPMDETYISWEVRADRHCSDYKSPREYFLDNGLLGFRYVPKTRIPGERWRMHKSLTSNEISAVLRRIKFYGENFFAAEERLVRWGLVMHISSKLREFHNSYLGCSEKWKHILHVLDACEENIKITTNLPAKCISSTLSMI